nr:H84 [uncultured bacterium]
MSSAANMVSRLADVPQWCGVVMFVMADPQWADTAAAIRCVVVNADAVIHGEWAP